MKTIGKGIICSILLLTSNGALAQTTIGGSVYGGGAFANTGSSEGSTTTVNLTGGVVNGSIYGGGLGRLAAGEVKEGDVVKTPAVTAVAAEVGGAVTVNLNKDVANDAKGCVVKGNIFGCNNINGTPKGSVTVHIYKTQNEVATQIANPIEGEQNAKEKGRYDVSAVYGGGNQAAYDPTDLVNGKTKVIIDGCDETSIEYVYGGGNAASIPASEVTVNSSYEIGSVFGGGNGRDPIDEHTPNPGANVGYKAIVSNYVYDNTKSAEENAAAEAEALAAAKLIAEYGSGKSIVYLKGGIVHSAFGGSNTLGNVRVSSTVSLNEPDEITCPIETDEIYGAGNIAEMDGASQIELGCVSYLKAIYGGAKNANVNNDINLTIQSGRFDRIFGGNNLGGIINGSITVNIEETGCHPIIIGQLYGSGNQASYTTPENKQGPTVNIMSFTSIGEVYGGGYGSTAVVTGDTHINIDEQLGTNASNEVTDGISRNTGLTVDIIADKDNEGNNIMEAVYIPQHTEGTVGVIGNVYGGGNQANVTGNTFVNIGTKNNTANISGNVYGGGNNADVTGNANVQIGVNASSNP